MSAPAWQFAALAILSVVLIGAGIRVALSYRQTPEKQEQRRRLYVNERGRLSDGLVMDVGPNTIYYEYAVAGVAYRTSQDVGQLSQFLPPDPESLIGPVTLKYSPRNPANSIVLCEVWSGLRTTSKEIVSNDA